MRETRTLQTDHVFLWLLGALVAFGLVMLTSASGPVAIQKYHGDAYHFLTHQVLFGLLPGTVLFVIASRIDYRFWKRVAKPVFIAAVLLLLLVFVPGIGAQWGTTRSWIGVGGFSLQPAEIMKVAFLLFMASWLEAADPRELSTLRGGLLPFITQLGFVGVILMLQPDLGTLLVIGGMAAAVYFLAGAPWAHLLGLGAAGAAAVTLLINTVKYRADRLIAFLHPELDPRGVGYHINQAFLAVGSGGWFGLGLGHSRQKYLYLPEVANDSIFAVAAEELGFITVLLVLGLFLAFLWHGASIARSAPDRFGRLVASGIVAWVFFQMLFNIGSMVGLLPLTGLPLPFVSYGGTALMMLLAAMGVLHNIAMQSAAVQR
jgi:cell division protein FtsW